MELKICIYNDNGEVTKEFLTNNYKIKMKVIKKFTSTIDLELLGRLLSGDGENVDDMEIITKIGQMINGSYELVREITISVFPEMSEEEFDEIAINDLAVFLINLFKFTVNTISISSTSKN